MGALKLTKESFLCSLQIIVSLLFILTAIEVSAQKAKDVYKDIPVTLIIGESFLQKQDLIYHMGAHYGVRCFERSLLSGEDVILDDRTCMLFHPLHSLTARPAKGRFMYLSLVQEIS